MSAGRTGHSPVFREMKRFLYELSESWKIAASQMRSNLTRSTLTALGVIIGIVAVTLMGTAIGGIQVGFDKSMSIFGDDVLYVGQWPWRKVDDWWNYRDRKKAKFKRLASLRRTIRRLRFSRLCRLEASPQSCRGKTGKPG